MDDVPQLESEIHKLLEEANLLLLARVPNVAQTRHLIVQMGAIAAKAKVAGADYEEAEERLRHAAHALAQKIGAAEL